MYGRYCGALIALIALVSALPLPAFADGLTARALLVPRNEVVLSSQISGRIERMSAEAGDRFARGDLLVGMDCAHQRAELRKQTAEKEAARHRLEAQKRLRELDSGSELELSLAASALAEAVAKQEMAAATVAHCDIRAPYDGRVVERRAQRFQNVRAGDPLIAILEDAALRVELIVPSHWLAWLKEGHPFIITVDETGKGYPARVERIGARIDPASQSLRITGAIDGDFGELMAGMSGTAQFTPAE